MDYEVIHQGWLYVNIDSSKPALKLKSRKQWKYRYFVLYRELEDSNKVLLACFKKEEHWRNFTPKNILKLFPKYRIAKLHNFKAKEYALEVNNFEEQWFLSIENAKIIDLWAIQIQMQTKLSRFISGRIFQVSGVINKQMQQIGAAQQRCLLHFTQWGVTLALQDSRAILSMWPLTTIRNYECSGKCQFSIEAGRKAPMGEGLFVFYTNIGQDVEMFNVIDEFVNATLNKKAIINSEKKLEILKDDEISQTYDKLHSAALGLNLSPPIENAQGNTGYSLTISKHLNLTPTTSSSSVSMYKPPDYDFLFNNNESKRLHSNSSEAGAESPQELFVDGCYDHLSNEGRKKSSELKNCYDHISQLTPTGVSIGSYDMLVHAESGFNSPCMHSPDKTFDFPHHCLPLRDESPLPFSDKDSAPFKDCNLLSKSFEETYEFRNQIYISTLPNQNFPALEIKNHHKSMPSVRHNSNSSMHNERKGTPEFNNKSLKDIADHFLYQMPSSLSSPNKCEK